MDACDRVISIHRVCRRMRFDTQWRVHATEHKTAHAHMHTHTPHKHTLEVTLIPRGWTAHLVADLGTDAAHAQSVHQLTGVTVVPVLVHEGALGHGEGAQLVVQRLVTLLTPITQKHVIRG